MIQADIKLGRRRNDSHSRQQRAVESFIQRSTAKASHRDERMAAAEAKRLRKNEKRARDALHTTLGQMRAREVLEGTVAA